MPCQGVLNAALSSMLGRSVRDTYIKRKRVAKPGAKKLPNLSSRALRSAPMTSNVSYWFRPRTRPSEGSRPAVQLIWLMPEEMVRTLPSARAMFIMVG